MSVEDGKKVTHEKEKEAYITDVETKGTEYAEKIITQVFAWIRNKRKSTSESEAH